jgi:hypothetical protein
MEPKYQHTLNNHYKWGWADDVSNIDWYNKKGSHEAFHIGLGSVTREHQGFRQECINAAKDMVAKSDRPFIAAISGGSDSQVMYLSFMKAGADIRPAVIELEFRGKKVNKHDVDGAYEFCKKWGLTPEITKLDLEEFCTGECIDYVKEHQIFNPRTAIQLHLAVKYGTKDYTMLMAGGDMVLEKIINVATQRFIPGLWVTNSPVPILQALIDREIPGTTKFFMYSPELIHSYLDNQVVNGFRACQDPMFDNYYNIQSGKKIFTGGIWTHYMKPMIYATNWPEMQIRPKYHGFEHLNGYIKDTRALYRNMLGYIPGDYTVSVPVAPMLDHIANGAGSVKAFSDPWPEIRKANKPLRDQRRIEVLEANEEDDLANLEDSA